MKWTCACPYSEGLASGLASPGDPATSLTVSTGRGLSAKVPHLKNSQPSGGRIRTNLDLRVWILTHWQAQWEWLFWGRCCSGLCVTNWVTCDHGRGLPHDDNASKGIGGNSGNEPFQQFQPMGWLNQKQNSVSIHCVTVTFGLRAQ